jgi:hypothetical protein
MPALADAPPRTLAHYAPDVDRTAYVGLLREMGHACTCEFQLNTCAGLGV